MKDFLRFWTKVLFDDGCWLWTGARNGQGYGRFELNGRNTYAHRFAYETMIGPIPEGLTIDHVRERGCVARHCVNPAHLEPVTQGVNTLRGDTITARHAAKTHCPRNHPYAGDNLYITPRGRRVCRACRPIREKEATS